LWRVLRGEGKQAGWYPCYNAAGFKIDEFLVESAGQNGPAAFTHVSQPFYGESV